MKIKQNKELLGMMNEYNNFMQAEKRIYSPLIVSEPKKNHKDSLYAQEKLFSDVSFGQTFVTCELRNGDSKDCSLQILSDAFKKQVAFRYDSAGGVHRNDAPHIPLAEQSITAPHFHRYDSDGYFLAYKTDLLNNPKQAEVLFDIEFCFPYFCQEGKISMNEKRELPEIRIIRDGFLPLTFDDDDPLDGVNF